jgi:hypothetical protein
MVCPTVQVKIYEQTFWAAGRLGLIHYEQALYLAPFAAAAD